jgi:hypothetical protein
MTRTYAQKVTVGHQVAHPINNSTALIGVTKGGKLGLKGSKPHMELPLFYKKGKQPLCTLGACNPVNFTIFNPNETVWEVGKEFDF